MKVLCVASECVPFVKTGGLADVVGAFPGAFAAVGVDVRVLLPAYPAVKAALPNAKVLRRLPKFFGASRWKDTTAGVPTWSTRMIGRRVSRRPI
jgi:starch synthase